MGEIACALLMEYSDMRGRYIALLVLVAACAGTVGILVERHHLSTPSGADAEGPSILYWVAPMDPNFRKDGPGKSPMGMDLVPVYEGQESSDPEEVQLTAGEVNAIGVRTAVARMTDVQQTLHSVGFVSYDEHLVSHIHTRAEGWVERMKVRAVGDQVRAGEALFSIYAPDVTVASSELQRAVRRRDRRSAELSRRKLRNFGIDDAQIEEMAQAKEPVSVFRVHAPRSGVVTALAAADGMYLTPDVRALTITDLSSVWLLADIFERDIARLSEGMSAKARFAHLPRRSFSGQIDYIYPELDPKTRTLPVRLRFDNKSGLLKPGMYAEIELEDPIMRQAVTVPAEAVIRTGRASRVMLKTGQGRFRPRLVVTGLTGSFGDGTRTEIVQGLKPGEEVVASGQFLIDSESSLGGAIQRMSPTDESPVPVKGEVLAVNKATATVTLQHEAIDGLGWPSMATGFAVLARAVDLDGIKPGQMVRGTLTTGADGLLALTELGPDDGVEATGTGIIHAVREDGTKVSITHDPIPALNWPQMTMDLGLVGIKSEDVPLDQKVSFDLGKDQDGMFTILAIRPQNKGQVQDGMAGAEAQMDMSSDNGAAEGALSVMRTTGSIDSIDVSAGTVMATHGPLQKIGMPGMTMQFPLGHDLLAGQLSLGDHDLGIAMIDGQLTLVEAKPVITDSSGSSSMRVMGIILSVDQKARTAMVDHAPLDQIGMPAMVMSFPLVEGLDAQSLPVGEETQLLIGRGKDMSLTLEGVHAETVGQGGKP
ncbi:MAG: hypothetical protein Alpg2KO_21170 [Alphaproteobacteria bacterium]